MITGIAVALPEELSTLTSTKIAKGCCAFICDSTVIAYSGAGADNARRASELLITQGANRLISWGCAGALVDSLNPGDLVLADVLIDAEGCQTAIQSDWLKATQSVLIPFFKVRTGSLVESKAIVATSEDKKQLHLTTNAIAVDMESIAIAKIARLNNVPFLAIRVIADPAAMNLPKAINYALNNEGEVVLGKLLLFIALHPTQIPALISLGLHFNAAKNTLKQIARHIDQFSIFDQ